MNHHAALAAGSDNFVRKPFELDQIEALINGYLKFRTSGLPLMLSLSK